MFVIVHWVFALIVSIDCVHFHTQITRKYSTAMCYQVPKPACLGLGTWSPLMLKEVDMKLALTSWAIRLSSCRFLAS